MKIIDHHYTESGLQNVVISGIPVEVDDEGDEIITIPAINELHQVIALGIINHSKGMSGDELRFLRTEMGLTQSELAELVHKDKQSIGRWERGEIELNSSAEALIRRLAIEKLQLPSDAGIDELSRRSVPSAAQQSIKIQKVESNNRPYELLAA
ncbi:helix-turn-helix domain-containing protein [Shinella sp.]|uniref:helix-turn-helix domain-containing protein n=1 Tax=Shinella sp. TaxID=1870904 RepID=UPI0029BB7480|nr:helix-turn-helix domain-containing protein [Shinella sp.]MDX3976698.1 helix-turn-helix domain-containing protein [Shinella sp.]